MLYRHRCVIYHSLSNTTPQIAVSQIHCVPGNSAFMGQAIWWNCHDFTGLARLTKGRILKSRYFSFPRYQTCIFVRSIDGIKISRRKTKGLTWNSVLHTPRHPDTLCLLLAIASRTLGALLVPILQMWTLMLRDVLPPGLWLCGECPHQCPPAPWLPQARPHPSAERRTCPPCFSLYHHQDHLWKDPPC